MKVISFCRRLLLTLPVTVLALSGHAQPVLQWERTSPSVGSDGAISRKLFRIRPNGFAYVGGDYAVPFTAYTAAPYLVFVDGLGAVQRTYFLTGAMYRDDNIMDAVYNAGDGTFAIWGTHCDLNPTNPNQRLNYRPFLLLVDTLGQVRWRQDYTQYNSIEDGPTAMLAVPDGYLLAMNSPGSVQSYTVPALLKVNKQGRFQWYRRYPTRWGLGGHGSCRQLILCRDGSYLCMGTSSNVAANIAAGIGPFQGADYLLTQVAPWGDTIRTALLGRPTEHEDGLGVQQTRDGGFLLRGNYVASASGVNQTRQGELVKLDSLWRVQWRTDLAAAPTARYQDCELRFAYETTGGDVATGGGLLEAFTLSTPGESYLVGLGATGTVQWQQRRLWNNASTGLRAVVAEADGSARVLGDAANPADIYSPNFYLARYQNLGAPYVADYCARQPPVAGFGYATPAPDSLRLLDGSTAGPRYAVVSGWDWDFGDGSHSAESNPGHRYARVPPFGTAVRLTVTNNLGCTSTQVQYPFALGTRAGAGSGLALYPNPARGVVRLALPAGTGLEAGRGVELLDVLGQVVRRWPGGAGGELSLAGVAAGAYVLRVWVAGQPVRRRLVVAP